MNTSGAPGPGFGGDKPPCLYPRHSEDDSNRVALDTGFMKEQLRVTIFLTTTTKAGTQGSGHGAHSGGRTNLHQTMPLHPSTLGNCISTGAVVVAVETDGPLLQTSAAALIGLILGQFLLCRYILPSISPSYLFPSLGWLLWLLVCLNRHI